MQCGFGGLRLHWKWQNHRVKSIFSTQIVGLDKNLTPKCLPQEPGWVEVLPVKLRRIRTFKLVHTWFHALAPKRTCLTYESQDYHLFLSN